MPATRPTDPLLPFQKLQLAFAANIRDPDSNPTPTGIEERRMSVYREVLFNNIDELLSNGFPVLRSLSTDAVWEARVRHFFAEHHSQTPYFAEIGAEFLQWILNERGEHPDDPPFLAELVHYEWIEVAVWTSNADSETPDVDHNGDLFTGVPVASPVVYPLSYRYPVHRISADYLLDHPPEEPTYLAVNRDRQGVVHFLEINAVTFRLLEILQENQHLTGQDVLRQIVAELAHPDPEQVMTHGLALLDDLRQRNIIIGTMR